MESLSPIYVRDENGRSRKVARLENTEGYLGDTIFVGGVSPTGPVAGDVRFNLQGGSSGSGGGRNALLAPVSTSRTGDFNLSTSTSWTDVDPIGAPAARPMDLVFSNVEPGQMVEVEPWIYTVAAAGSGSLDMWSIVAGAPVNRFGAGESGGFPVTPWAVPNNLSISISGSCAYKVRPEDIEDGNLRLRLRYKHASGAQRGVFGTYGYQFRLTGRGPYQSRTGPVVVFDGQSLNHSSSDGSTSPDTFPRLTMEDLGLPWQVPAIQGTSWTVLSTTAIERVHALAKPYSSAVLVMTGGTSDLSNMQENDTAEKAIADMEAYADAARAAGYDKIIAATMTPATSYLDADDEIQRGLFNDYVRNSSHWEYVADFAAAPEFADPTDTTYFWADETHWNDPANAVAANILRPLVDQAVASLGGG